MSILDSDSLFAEVVQRLRLAVQDERSFEAAQVHLINLPEVIRSAGPDWPVLKDRIRSGSINFLRGCLSDADIVIPAGDGFLILFSEAADESLLRARAQELRLLLLEFYLGSDGMRDLRVAVQQRRVESKELRAMLLPPPAPALDDVVGDDFAFLPIWAVRPRLSATYLCTPFGIGAGGAQWGYDAQYAETGHNEHRDYCALDLEVLSRVETAFMQRASADLQPLLGCSVHVTTLQNRRARAAFLERLARVPDAYLKHLIIRVAEIEAGVPLLNLADWVGLLRARPIRILLEFHGSEPTPPDLSQIRVWAAGYHMIARKPGPQREQQLHRWGRELGRNNIKFALLGAPGAEWVHAAANAGAHFIGCTSLWPALPTPGDVVRTPPPITSKATP